MFPTFCVLLYYSVVSCRLCQPPQSCDCYCGLLSLTELSRAREARLKAVAMRKHRFWNFLSPSLFSRGCRPTIGCRWALKILGGVHYESFPVGFSMPGHSLVFWFGLGQHLAAAGQPRESGLSWVRSRS